MGMPFEGNCIHPRTKIKKNGSVFCLACHQIIKDKKPVEKVDWFNKIKRGDLEEVIHNINLHDAPFKDRGN